MRAFALPRGRGAYRDSQHALRRTEEARRKILLPRQHRVAGDSRSPGTEVHLCAVGEVRRSGGERHDRGKVQPEVVRDKEHNGSPCPRRRLAARLSDDKADAEGRADRPPVDNAALRRKGSSRRFRVFRDVRIETPRFRACKAVRARHHLPQGDAGHRPARRRMGREPSADCRRVACRRNGEGAHGRSDAEGDGIPGQKRGRAASRPRSRGRKVDRLRSGAERHPARRARAGRRKRRAKTRNDHGEAPEAARDRREGAFRHPCAHISADTCAREGDRPHVGTHTRLFADHEDGLCQSEERRIPLGGRRGRRAAFVRVQHPRHAGLPAEVVLHREMDRGRKREETRRGEGERHKAARFRRDESRFRRGRDTCGHRQAAQGCRQEGPQLQSRSLRHRGVQDILPGARRPLQGQD